jgi:predicted transcriptional regulator
MEKETLAEMTGVSSNTLRRLEAEDGPLDARTSTLRAIEAVLVRGGVELLDGDAPGARLRRSTTQPP